MSDDNIFEKFPRLRPVTPGGLLNKSRIRRFTPDLFNETNDHNPPAAKPCKRCKGQGFYRTPHPNRRDVTCEECGGMGFFEEEIPFFDNENKPVKAEPNKAGTVQCPHCGKKFPVYSNQFWTGLRHECGQKIILTGPHADMCWTRKGKE